MDHANISTGYHSSATHLRIYLFFGQYPEQTDRVLGKCPPKRARDSIRRNRDWIVLDYGLPRKIILSLEYLFDLLEEEHGRISQERHKKCV